jgi:hypothetical protein
VRGAYHDVVPVELPSHALSFFGAGFTVLLNLQNVIEVFFGKFIFEKGSEKSCAVCNENRVWLTQSDQPKLFKYFIIGIYLMSSDNLMALRKS